MHTALELHLQPKDRRRLVDKATMMNSVSLISTLASALAYQAAGVETGIVTLNKANEVARQEGNALVEMLENSIPQGNDRILDIYA